MNIALLAAIIGLLSLLATDQFGTWNKNKYEAEKKAGHGDREAFVKNRNRKAKFDRISFWILAAAAGLSMYSAFADKKESDEDIKKLNQSIARLGSRMQGMEAKLQTLAAESGRTAAQARQLEAQLVQHDRPETHPDPAGQAAAGDARLASVERDIRILNRRAARLEGRLRAIDGRRRAK